MRKISNVKVLPEYLSANRQVDWSCNLTTGYPELWTSRKPSAKACSLCGATRSPSSRFVSEHSANLSGPTGLICARTRFTLR